MTNMGILFSIRINTMPMQRKKFRKTLKERLLFLGLRKLTHIEERKYTNYHFLI